MQVQINGEKFEFESGITVSALASKLQLDTSKIAIERNRKIVPSSAYEKEVVADGDDLEIVGFVGGG